MIEANRLKLKDYLQGFIGLNITEGVPVGAILISEKDHDDVVEILEAAGVPVVRGSTDRHPDEILRDMMKQMRLNAPVALDILELHPKILNQLHLLAAEGRMVTTLAGREDVYLFKPESATHLFCICTSIQFETLSVSELFSSVCRLG